VHKKTQPYFRLAAAVLASLFIVSTSEPSHAAVPAAWTAVNVGTPAILGSAQDATCTATSGCPVFTISGAGVGIGGTADQFMFLYQKLTGDGVIRLRLLSLAGTSTMEAGLMLRESPTASARHVAILASATGTTVRSRIAAGGATGALAVSRAGWLRLERVGSVVTASISSEGTQWTVVSAQTQTLPATVYVGIAVTSRSANALATATVAGMAVTPTTPTMPSGWSSADVGVAPSPGTASYSSGSFIAASHGSGLGAGLDAFRFLYTRVRGDAKLMTRVVASQGPAGRQAGIALRTTLDAGAAEVALVADDVGVVLVRRSAAGQTASRTRVATTVAPVHLQLNRVGSMVTVAYSTDGSTWTTVTSVAVSFGTDLYAGLAVAAGPNGGVAAAAFDRLSLIAVAANAPPLVSLASPGTGQLFLTGTTVAMSATASDPDDLVARVDFRVNGVKVASDSAAPYSATWTAGAAGVYSVVAAAADYDGAVTTSSPATITVAANVLDSGSSTGGTGPWKLTFSPSSDHAWVDYYVLEIYNPLTRVRLLTHNIGKPAVSTTGSCAVDIDALISALPSGLYEGVVRAVVSAGTAPSAPYTFSR
jgi:regulation of enolase protein 1 (concanavalin A-like superfamily)